MIRRAWLLVVLALAALPAGAGMEISSAAPITINARYETSVNQPVVSMVETDLLWDVKVFDDNSIRSATFQNRFVVPAGMRWAKVSASTEWQPNGTGLVRSLQVLKNGTIFPGGVRTTMPVFVPIPPICFQVHTGWLPVIAGDYFTVNAYHDASSTISVVFSTWHTWAYVEMKSSL